MSTIEDFKNAPVGATATHALASRAMKTAKSDGGWVTPSGNYFSDEGMVNWGYTLDPLEPAPTTANEALDLAWKLAHPVKEGQVIPKGTHYLDRSAPGLMEFASLIDFKVRPGIVIRTVEPLPEPEPEPDWLDALVVLARHVKAEPDSPPTLWANLGSGMWGHVETTKRVEAWDLRDVTPLYPKETDR